MVQEIRDIMLSIDEVQEAFVQYQRMAPDFLPSGKIVEFKTHGESIIIKVDMTYGGSIQRSEFAFKGVEVLRPLIRFCIDNNIMLPRNGKKSILFKEDKISMHIELDLLQDFAASLKPVKTANDAEAGSQEVKKLAAGQK
jgi:hypothetical protein